MRALLISLIFFLFISPSFSLEGARISKSDYKTMPKVIDFSVSGPKTLDDISKAEVPQGKLKDEQYHIYKIMDKIIRSNNLEYQNWRLGFDLSPTEINAYSTSANLIVLNSALYDSLNQDDGALAFVLCHEISHLLLGHGQQTAIYSMNISNIEYKIQKLKAVSRQSQYYSDNNPDLLYSNLGTQASSAIQVARLNKQLDKMYVGLREQEYNSDAQGLIMHTRAGYEYNGSTESMTLLSEIPSIYSKYNSHPPIEFRVKELNVLSNSIPTESLVDEGRINREMSSPLDFIISMDKRTFVINKPLKTPKKLHPKLDTYDFLLEIASYACETQKWDDMLRNLKFANSYNPKDPRAPLYISYAYSNKYFENNNKEDLKESLKWANKAASLVQNEQATVWRNELKTKYEEASQ